MKRSALHYAVPILALLVLAITFKPQGKSGPGPADDAKPAEVNRANRDGSLDELVSASNPIVEPADEEAPGDDAASLIAPELKTIREALKPILATLAREAKIESSDHSLVMTYLPQTYSVRRRKYKAGEGYSEPRDEVGPSRKGFVLRAHMNPLGEVNQLVTPQVVQQPYWLSYFDITPIGKTDQQVFWSISYTPGIDQKLLEKLRGTMKGLKDLPADR